ncbi:MAG: hypothetical protein GWN58_26335 [Anaerolineae bacterium]|nr:hypothetical protein [Anaerolineae bacterium]
MDRQLLRQQVWRACLQYVPNQGPVVLCSWCGEPIEDEMDLHEYLVKRSSVSPDKQPLIMVPENLAPLHHSCHMAHGQEREMAVRCLHHIGHLRGLRRIGEWYVALWQEHELGVPRGILIPPGKESVPRARNYYERGRTRQAAIPERVDELQVGYAIRAWRGKRVKLPEGTNAIMHERMVRAVDDGYWLDYLEGILGWSAADYESLRLAQLARAGVESG